MNSVKNENYALFFQWLQNNDFDYPYAETSIRTYKMVILAFIAFLAENHILVLKEANTAILRQFIKYRKNGEKYNINSSNKRKAAVNLFFAWAAINGYCDENPLKAYDVAEKEQRSFGGRQGREPPC